MCNNRIKCACENNITCKTYPKGETFSVETRYSKVSSHEKWCQKIDLRKFVPLIGDNKHPSNIILNGKTLYQVFITGFNSVVNLRHKMLPSGYSEYKKSKITDRYLSAESGHSFDNGKTFWTTRDTTNAQIIIGEEGGIIGKEIQLHIDDTANRLQITQPRADVNQIKTPTNR